MPPQTSTNRTPLIAAIVVIILILAGVLIWAYYKPASTTPKVTSNSDSNSSTTTTTTPSSGSSLKTGSDTLSGVKFTYQYPSSYTVDKSAGYYILGNTSATKEQKGAVIGQVVVGALPTTAVKTFTDTTFAGSAGKMGTATDTGNVGVIEYYSQIGSTSNYLSFVCNYNSLTDQAQKDVCNQIATSFKIQ